MSEIWISKKGIAIAIVSFFIGTAILFLLENNIHEKLILQANQDAELITEEIKSTIVNHSTILHTVRSLIKLPESDNFLSQYILNLEENNIKTLFYIGLDSNKKKIKLLNTNNEPQNLLDFQNNIDKYKNIDEKNKIDQIRIKVIKNQLILNLPVFNKEKDTIGIIGVIINTQNLFAKFQKNKIEYEIFLKENYPQNINSNKINYYDNIINWHNIKLITRVYIETPTIWNVFLYIIFITFGLIALIYVILLKYIYLISENSNAQFIAKEISKEIKHLNWHDSLTQLYNRYKITQELDLKINSLVNKNQRLFIICLDLQGFKRVNGELGHTAGDVLLQEYGARLVKNVPDIFEVVARASGDEFLVVVDAKKLNKNSFNKEIEFLSEEFNKIIEDVFIIHEEKFIIKHKIGISIYPDHGRSGEQLFKYAELAMYEAKVHEETTFVYHIELAQKLTVLNKMKISLALAISNNEFYLVYQPKVTFNREGIKKDSAEVLCRWRSPIFGNVAPDVFISLAEETGEIHKLGKWVTTESTKQLNEWNKKGFNIKLSINLSPKQLLNPNLPIEFYNIFKDNNIDPKQVSLEMTENSMIVDKEQSQIILNGFHDLGFRIAIDDFGKGYSSLSYLKDYPISEIKMDKAFIDDITDNQFNQILVEGIILVSSKLGIDLVIEGVENIEQTEFLSKMGCNKFQGYYFSKPLSAEDLEKYLLL